MIEEGAPCASRVIECRPGQLALSLLAALAPVDVEQASGADDIRSFEAEDLCTTPAGQSECDDDRAVAQSGRRLRDRA